MVLHEFGHQLLLKAHSKDIKNKADVLTLFIHWRLLRYGFICMGDGVSQSSIPSEVLPLNLGWNGDLRGYFLKYEVKKKTFLLSVHIKDDMTEIGLLSDSRVTKVGVDPHDCVTDSLYMDTKTSEDFAFLIDTDLIMPQGFKRVEEKWMALHKDTAIAADQASSKASAEGLNAVPPQGNLSYGKCL